MSELMREDRLRKNGAAIVERFFGSQIAADANRGREGKRVRLLHDDVFRGELDVVEHVAAHE